MSIHPDKPFFGPTCFSDIYGMTQAHIDLLIKRRVVFTTEFDPGNGIHYGGIIIAPSWADAERVAAERMLGEKVTGTLEGIIPADDGGGSGKPIPHDGDARAALLS